MTDVKIKVTKGIDMNTYTIVLKSGFLTEVTAPGFTVFNGAIRFPKEFKMTESQNVWEDEGITAMFRLDDISAIWAHNPNRDDSKEFGWDGIFKNR